ncbi:MAG: alpha/beta hydrolase [Bacteroidota bacterium]
MNDFDPVTQDPLTNDPKFPATILPASFISGGDKVLGTMLIASGEGPHPTVLLLNGFPGNEVNYDIAHMMQRQGFNVFTFYYRGSWGSKGEFSWSNLIEDSTTALEFLRSIYCREKFMVDGSRIVFVGYSMGGFSVLFNSICFDQIKNVAAIAPFNPGLFGHVLETNSGIKIYAVQELQPAMDFVNSCSAEGLLEDMIKHKSDWNLLNYAEKLSKKNLLIISAQDDLTAPVQLHHHPLVNALRTFNGNLQDFILETGHSFSNKRIQLMKIISEWLNQIKF